MFDIEKIRSEFPLLSREVHGSPLVYLDNGASTQKPQTVIDAIEAYYSRENANVHRGVHHLSQQATTRYEQARETIQTFLNAEHSHEVLFTKGTTDSVNLLAEAWGRHFLKAGDEVIISYMEHHSNIVPWQMICESQGAILKVIPINQSGELIMEEYKALLSDRTKMVSVTHISNTLGTINPVKEIIEMAHDKGALVAIDGAQAVPHIRVDVRELDADFYIFSGHKIFGPTGVGILYGKEAVLNSMPPYQGGGNMIEKVTFEKTTYNVLPHKFEPGTPNIVGGIGLGVAIDYFNSIDQVGLHEHEQDLLDYATEGLLSIVGVTIIGTAAEKACVISFLLEGTHPFDVGTILDQQGIAVRTGHHCTQPLMEFYKTPGTIRASFALYNNRSDVDALIAGVKRAAKMLL